LAEAEAALASLDGKSVGVNFDTSVTDTTTGLTKLGSELDSVRSKLLTIEDLQPWDSINANAAKTQLALLDAQLAQLKADAVIDLVLNFDDGAGGVANAESIGSAVGEEYMTGLYHQVFSSPDWELISNIARDSLGNQLALGAAGEAAGEDYMTGFYRQVQSSPDWRLISNIARDELGNQLALPAAGETGEGSGGESGGGGGGISGLLGMLGGGGGEGGSSGINGIKLALLAIPAAAGAAVGGLSSVLSFGGGGASFLTYAHLISASSSALIAIAGAAAPAVVGLGAFGIAAFQPVMAAYTAVNNLNTALASGSPTAIAAAQRAMANLTPEEQAMAAGFQKSQAAFSKWTAKMSPYVLKVFNALIGQTGGLLNDLSPMVKAASGALAPLILQFKSDMTGPMAKGIAKFTTEIGPAITGWGDLFMHFLNTLMGIMTKAGSTMQPFFTLANSLVTLFGGLFSALAGDSVPVLKALNAIVVALEPIFKAIGSILPPLKVVTAALGGALAAAIRIVAPMFESLAPVIEKLAGPFSKLAPAVLGLELFGPIGMLIGAAIPYMKQLGPILGKIVTAVGQLIAPLVTGLGPILKALGPIIAILVQALASGLLSAIVALIPAVKVLAPIVADVLVFGLKMLTWVLKALGPALVPVLAIIVALFSPTVMFVAAIALLVAAITFLVDHWGKIWNEIKNITEIVWKAILGALKAAWHYILVIFRNATVVGLIYSHWNTIKSDATKIWKAILGFLKTAWHYIIVIFENATIVGLIYSHWNTIKSDATKVWDAIVGFLKAAWDTISSRAVRGVERIVGFVKHGWDTVSSDTRAVWDAIIGFIKNAWDTISSRAIRGVERIAGFIRNGWDTVSSDTRSVWDSIVGFLRGIPGDIMGIFSGAGSWLFNAGKNVVLGLAHGITSMAGAVTGAISHVVHGVTSIAHKILGILSPSTVFADIGRNVVQGFANGILGAASVAHGAVTQMSTDAIAAGRMGSNMTGIGSTLGNSMSSTGVNPVSASAAANSQPIILQVTTPLQINGQTLANAVTKYMLRNARSQNTALGQYSGSSMAAGATGINVNAVQR
jgi:phage-related protein